MKKRSRSLQNLHASKAKKTIIRRNSKQIQLLTTNSLRVEDGWYDIVSKQNKAIQSVFKQEEPFIIWIIISFIFDHEISLHEKSMDSYNQIPIRVPGAIFVLENDHCLTLLEKLSDSIISIHGRLKVKYHMHEESLKRFCSYLSEIPPITSIDFEGIGLRDDSFIHIANALLNNHHIDTIDLKRNDLCAESAKALHKLMVTNRNIRNLHLENNWLGQNGGAEDMAEMLKQNNTLKHLNLSSNDFLREGLISICEGLAINTSIIYLDLSRNSFTNNQNGIGLAEALKFNQNIKTLNLRGCNFSELGFLSLCQALEVSDGIKNLDLSSNNLNPDTINALSHHLQSSNSLKSLRLENCDLNEKLLHILMKPCAKYNSLKKLYISNNNFGEKGLEILTEHLQNSVYLHDLEIQNTGFKSNGGTILEKRLSYCQTLKTLDLSNNFIGFALRWRLNQLKHQNINLIMENCV